VEAAGSDGEGAVTSYHLPPLVGTWAVCAKGLAHPYTNEIRPVVFDHDLAAGRDDVVLAHLGHRLVQMCLRLLRAEIWAPEGQRKLHRVSARVVPDRKPLQLARFGSSRSNALVESANRWHRAYPIRMNCRHRCGTVNPRQRFST